MDDTLVKRFFSDSARSSPRAFAMDREIYFLNTRKDSSFVVVFERDGEDEQTESLLASLKPIKSFFSKEKAH